MWTYMYIIYIIPVYIVFYILYYVCINVLMSIEPITNKRLKWNLVERTVYECRALKHEKSFENPWVLFRSPKIIFNRSHPDEMILSSGACYSTWLTFATCHGHDLPPSAQTIMIVCLIIVMIPNNNKVIILHPADERSIIVSTVIIVTHGRDLRFERVAAGASIKSTRRTGHRLAWKALTPFSSPSINSDIFYPWYWPLPNRRYIIIVEYLISSYWNFSSFIDTFR